MNDMSDLVLDVETDASAETHVAMHEAIRSHLPFLRVVDLGNGDLALDVVLDQSSETLPRAGSSLSIGKVTLVIGANESVTLIVPGGEMGQGINSALAQILAEELPLDFNHIRTVPSPLSSPATIETVAVRTSDGARGVREYFEHMLDAGAMARAMLLAAAAQRSNAPTTVRAVAGYTDTVDGRWIPNSVVDGTGQRWSYGELAADAARTSPVVKRMSDPSSYRIIGTAQLRPDIREKVNGKAIFGLDVRLPGMKYAVVKHAPVLGARVERMGSSPDGTQAVNLDTAVAVVAGDTWSARKALNALPVSWTEMSYADRAFVDTNLQNSCLTSLLSSPVAAIAEATPESTKASSLVRLINSQPAKLSATYTLPMLAHACMEVLNCTVQIIRSPAAGIVEIVNVWCPTQAPDQIARTIAKLIPSLDPDRITVTATLMGGGFGRKLEQDFVEQAVRVALAVKAPVKLMWWRDDDFARDWFRPAAMSKIQVGIDKTGKIQGWYNRIASPSVMRSHDMVGPDTAHSSFSDPLVIGSAAGTGDEPMPYKDAMARRVVDYVEQKTGFNIGFWRSSGQSISCFAVESAIDECARLLGEDPYAYRASLLDSNPQVKALLDDVAQLSNWNSPQPPGTALGIAVSTGAGSRAALVAELSKVTSGNSSTIKVSRIFCSVDCGIAINPDQVVAQIEGGIMQGLSAARWGKMTFDKGVCQVRNFGQYRLSRMADTPEIIVRIVSQGSKLGGIGEVGVPPVAPALANAYAALTGVRKRSLPLEF